MSADNHFHSGGDQYHLDRYLYPPPWVIHIIRLLILAPLAALIACSRVPDVLGFTFIILAFFIGWIVIVLLSPVEQKILRYIQMVRIYRFNKREHAAIPYPQACNDCKLEGKVVLRSITAAILLCGLILICFFTE